MSLNDIHIPVMLDRCVALLAPALQRDGAVLVDATEGMGGHSVALLERFDRVALVGLDRDTDALAIAARRLAPFGDRVHLVHTVYDGIIDAVRSSGFAKADGILFDLGVSSLQLDEADRGFAYAKDAPLDMRMDQTTGRTAADVIATSSEGQLRRIFEIYGEEKLAGRYARFIVTARQQTPILTSAELVRIITEATPAALSHAGHPAKRVFQALRVEVNSELSVLADALPRALSLLPVGGRIVVMAYQSLEDRIVKRLFAEATASTAPPGLPVEREQDAPRFRALTRGAEQADDEERERNPRSTPVRLRAIERVREDG